MLAETTTQEVIQNISVVVFLVFVGIILAMLVMLMNKIDVARTVVLGRLESHDSSVLAQWTGFLNHNETIRAHEMRTPLTVVIANLSMIADRGDLPQEMRRELAQTALERAKELTRVVDKYQAEGSN